MVTGWRYRTLGAVGTAVATILAIFIANHPFSQAVFTTYVPIFWRLEPTILSGNSLRLALFVSVLIVLVTHIPLFKPRPQRILDTILQTQGRILVAGLTLATIGFFKWSHRLPRATLVMLVGILLIILPLWFVVIRHNSNGNSDRTLIVGDDLSQIERVKTEVELNIIGYLSPPSVNRDFVTATPKAPKVTDGGMNHLRRIGGLSRLEDVLIEDDIDTVILAFVKPDRAEFFGTLDTCAKHGITPKVHVKYSHRVLTGRQNGPLINVSIEPWDVQDYFLKRIYDILFASIGLVLLSPLMIIIVISIKLDSEGPVFFSQERTRQFGQIFTFYKFRTMVKNAEEKTGVVVSQEDAGEVDPRVTRTGRILRKTHLDELPQLWSVLIGDMSVVGPRPAQSEIEEEFEKENPEWVKRWFVKPGLTGLAQIEDATGLEPNKKLHYDLLYIQNQSLIYDIKLTIRQFWKIGIEMYTFLRNC